MAKFNVLITDGISERGLALLEKSCNVSMPDQASAEQLLQMIPKYDAIIVRGKTRVTKELISTGTRLKVIGRAGVGVDNIDLPAARSKGVMVVNCPLSATVAVAELTLGLMISLVRSIPGADLSLKQGKWHKSAFIGSELRGKTLGLLGLGRIGAQVAHYAMAFGMKILAYDTNLVPAQIEDRGATPASFDEVLSNSDFISLHLPLTDETRGMLGAEQFNRMKRGAYLLCLARGGVINEEALRAALDTGRLSGAALDVFEVEPPPAGSIAEHPHVIATPHIGAQTQEAQENAGLDIAEEVLAVLTGREARWPVW